MEENTTPAADGAAASEHKKCVCGNGADCCCANEGGKCSTCHTEADSKSCCSA